MRKITLLKLVILLVSFFTMSYGLFEACAPDSVFLSCHSYFRDIPFILWSVSLSIFLISVLMIFFRTEVFIPWFIFSVVFIPLSAFLIFFAPTQTHDLITPFDKKMTALWLSSVFFLISLLLIAYKFIRLKTAQKKG